MRNALIVHEVVTRATMKLLPVQSLCLLFISGLIQGVALGAAEQLANITTPGFSTFFVRFLVRFSTDLFE